MYCQQQQKSTSNSQKDDLAFFLSSTPHTFNLLIFVKYFNRITSRYFKIFLKIIHTYVIFFLSFFKVRIMP